MRTYICQQKKLKLKRHFMFASIMFFGMNFFAYSHAEDLYFAQYATSSTLEAGMLNVQIDVQYNALSLHWQNNQPTTSYNVCIAREPIIVFNNCYTHEGANLFIDIQGDSFHITNLDNNQNYWIQVYGIGIDQQPHLYSRVISFKTDQGISDRISTY